MGLYVRGIISRKGGEGRGGEGAFQLKKIICQQVDGIIYVCMYVCMYVCIYIWE